MSRDASSSARPSRRAAAPWVALVWVLPLLVACPRAEEPAAAPVVEEKLAPVAPPLPPRLEHGFDVSEHSGAIDWTTLEGQPFHFAILKATEGVDLEDSAFADHWARLAESSFVRGAYHFYVTEDDPEEQAEFFTSRVSLAAGDLRPIVDVELIGHGTPPGLPDRVRRFLELLEAHYGVAPILYTSARFWNDNLTADFGRYPLWIAEYEVEAPTLPEGWTEWHLWQWKGDAEVPGVEKGADLSRVNPMVSVEDLLVPHPELGSPTVVDRPEAEQTHDEGGVQAPAPAEG